jgi:hypothetical protein
MRKTKLTTPREFSFTAPFSLKICEMRLETKQERTLTGTFQRFITTTTEAYVNRVGPETRSFTVTRGSAVVHGRLDMLSENSTWVSMESSIDWLGEIVNLIWLPVILVAIFPLGWGLAFITSVFSWELGSYVSAIANFLTGNPVLVAGCILLYLAFRVLTRRDELAREIERALTDQIQDIPDLGDLEDVMSGTDGELVAAPPLQAARLVEELNLETLMKSNGRKPKK